MVTSNEIRDRLADAIVGTLPFEDFEDWFVQQSWNVHQSKDFDSQRLVFEIELVLAERSAGHLDVDTLGRELRRLLNAVPAHIGTLPQPVAIKGGSSYLFNLQKVPGLQMLPAGKSPVTAFESLALPQSTL
jgi:hypothetical protein